MSIVVGVEHVSYLARGAAHIEVVHRAVEPADLCTERRNFVLHSLNGDVSVQLQLCDGGRAWHSIVCECLHRMPRHASCDSGTLRCYISTSNM